MSSERLNDSICEERISPGNICIMAILSLLFSIAVGGCHMGNVCIDTEIVAKNSEEETLASPSKVKIFFSSVFK